MATDCEKMYLYDVKNNRYNPLIELIYGIFDMTDRFTQRTNDIINISFG